MVTYHGNMSENESKPLPGEMSKANNGDIEGVIYRHSLPNFSRFAN